MTMSPLSWVATVIALMVVVPVGLGFLLRLLLQTPRPILVGLLGAALILGVAYLAGDTGAGSQFSTRERHDVTLPVALAVHVLGLLFSMLVAFLFVNGGVILADRWRAVRASRTPHPQSP